MIKNEHSCTWREHGWCLRLSRLKADPSLVRSWPPPCPPLLFLLVLLLLPRLCLSPSTTTALLWFRRHRRLTLWGHGQTWFPRTSLFALQPKQLHFLYFYLKFVALIFTYLPAMCSRVEDISNCSWKVLEFYVIGNTFNLSLITLTSILILSSI